MSASSEVDISETLHLGFIQLQNQVQQDLPGSRLTEQAATSGYGMRPRQTT
jgi:hypothetical protein